jgi:antitoxin (DNA-binding transcriptional repressor) of toxin-antitoxin stability system
MQAVTIREAKARLNALVEAAVGGEQVGLMRGSKHVVLIVPLTDADLDLRLVFALQPDLLTLVHVGSHDEVRRFLRSL